MPAARKIIAKVIMFIGIVLGLAALTLWANIMWPVVAEDAVPRHATRDVMVIVFGGFGLLGVVVWPFAWIAERIDRTDERPS